MNQEQPLGEFHTAGLVIRTLPYSESSQIVTLLTAGGLVDVMAKGIGRKASQLRGPLDHWLMVEVQAKRRKTEGALADLRSCRHVAWFPRLRRSLGRYYASEVIREVLLRAPLPADDAPEVLRLALVSVRHLELGKRASIDVVVEFLARWLVLQGLQPELEYCVRSGRRATGKASVLFSYRDYGLVSAVEPDEEAGRDYETVAPKVLRLLKRVFGLDGATDERFRTDDRRKVCMLVARLVMIALGRELKSLRGAMKEFEREGPQT